MSYIASNYLETAKESGFEKGNKLLLWLAFFMITPVLLIGTNVSIYAFLYFFFYLYRTGQIKLSLNNNISKITLCFGIGIMFSVLGTLFKGFSADYFYRGLAVIFNYWYWCLLVILIINLRNKIDFLNLSKGVFWGINFLVLYFHILSGFMEAIPGFRSLQQNTFSFILICFSPLALYYVSQTGSKYKLWLFAGIYILAAFLSGSRTGSVFVLFNNVIFVYFHRTGIKVAYLVIAAILFALFVFLDVPGMMESFVYELNPRTYNLLYKSDNITETDISFLVRVAVLKKGLMLFNEHPLTGIGLNNFGSHIVPMDYSFKGAELIKHNDEHIRHASAHNSYISILAESGLMGFVPFVSLLLYNILAYIQNLNKWTALHLALFLGLICMSAHLYLISAILNVFAWFFIAIVSAYISLPKSKFKILN